MNSGDLGVWMSLLSRLPASGIWRGRKRPDLDTRFRELSGGRSAAWVGGRARVLPPCFKTFTLHVWLAVAARR